jgi:hypothetical protein
MQESGFEGVDISPRLRRAMASALELAQKTPHELRGFRTERVSCNVLKLLSSEALSELMHAIRDDVHLQRLLLAHLGRGAALAGIQHIVCPPHTPRQDLHRDSVGERRAVELAVSLSDDALKTWFLPGSHKRALSKAELAASVRETDLVQPLLHSVVYDSAIVHCGGATGTIQDDARLFFTFVDVHVPRKVLRSVLHHHVMGWKSEKGCFARKVFE